MTHEDLRKRAVRWLISTRHCGVVLSELDSYNPGNEIPDVIGWHGITSIVVEVKIGRPDFLANANKCCSRSGILMGSQRYFMVPRGLVTAEELEGSEYGLLSVADKQVRVEKEAISREDRSWRGEIAMLVSAMRRVKTLVTIVPEDTSAE